MKNLKEYFFLLIATLVMWAYSFLPKKLEDIDRLLIALLVSGAIFVGIGTWVIVMVWEMVAWVIVMVCGMVGR